MNENKELIKNELLLTEFPEPFKIFTNEITDIIVYIDQKKPIEGQLHLKYEKDFNGYLLLDSNKKRAYYFERLVEKGSGINPHKTNNYRSWNGFFYYKIINYRGLKDDNGLGFSKVRNLIKNVLEFHDWQLELVFTKCESTFIREKTSRTSLFLRKFFTRFMPKLFVLSVYLIAFYLLFYKSTGSDRYFGILIFGFLMVNLLIRKFSKK